MLFCLAYHAFLFELMEMFFPLIGYIIVLHKRFNQFEYELSKSDCRIYWVI